MKFGKTNAIYEESLFFYIKSKLFINAALFLLFINLSYSQNNKNKITHDEIVKEIKIISDLSLEKSSISVLKVLNKLNEVEKRVIQSNDKDNILFFYAAAIDNSIESNDFEGASNYQKKGIAILKKHDNKRYLGLFYEIEGVINNYLNKSSYKKDRNIKRDIAFINAEFFLSKYGTDEDNIDANFNLCLVYKDKGDWQKVYYHAQRAKEFIDKTHKKKSRYCLLNLYLGESLIRINQPSKAKIFLNEVQNDSLFKVKHLSTLSRFYFVEGLYYKSLKNYEKASESITKSIQYDYLFFSERSNEIKQYLNLKNDLKIKKIENQKIINENKLNRKQLVYRNYGILLSTSIIVVLIFLILLLRRSSKYKVEISKTLFDNNIELLKANKQIKKAIYDKKFFLDTMTHELRTPLNTIKGISFLLNSTDEKNKMEYAENITFSSDYLLKLINNMIDFNSFEKNSKPALSNEIVNIKQFVKKIIHGYSVNNENENAFLLHFDDSISENLLLDKFRITQIFINLVDNANKFTKKGTITIKALLINNTESTNKIRFVIEDTGIGIDKKNQKKIFDLFFQGSKEINRKYGGSGIGLSIVKKTLELYNSKIIVESELGKGTMVSFEIIFELSNNQIA